MANPNVVVITGESRGIGAETARLFAQHGYFWLASDKLSFATGTLVDLAGAHKAPISTM